MTTVEWPVLPLNRTPPGSYFPAIPPPTPPEARSYPQAVRNAPVTALMGIVVDGRQPERHPETVRCRVRKQVGSTNRWRLPQSLGSDLLGTSQAVKAIKVPAWSDSVRSIMTGESACTSVNRDPEKVYTFQTVESRPFSSPRLLRKAALSRSSSPSIPSPPRTAPAQMVSPRLAVHKPLTPHYPTPAQVFHYHSKHIFDVAGPDVVLHCLSTSWELHKPFLQKSKVLSELLYKAENPKQQQFYRDRTAETLDRYIRDSDIYSNEYQEISQRLNTVTISDGPRKGLSDPAHTSIQRTRNVTAIKLKIKDANVTKEALAIALGNLYHDDTRVDEEDVAGVMAAAYHMQCAGLLNGCSQIMIDTVKASNVCTYMKAAIQYEQSSVITTCERWLELNLVPQLSLQIHLRELPMEVMIKLLKSTRLFTYNEYSLYKALCNWIFLRRHPELHLMPSHSSIITYFNSLPKHSAFLEREEGQVYSGLFLSLKLHGITDTSHLDDIQQMNILPYQWLLRVLTQHYHSLQAGGDMRLLQYNFYSGSVRAGFIMEQDPPFYCEVMSIHGFHFELKAVRLDAEGTYTFYIQRLKPSDPVLSFRACERHTFSLRQDRDVRYDIKVQCFLDGQYQCWSTGVQAHGFGLDGKTSRSKPFTLSNLKCPVYATFHMVFPPT
ncbi:BTB/POZ domain-containing protein 16-like isoform X1 [Branchiostoma floridae]|uniref:BTB/POZ domain-containing protein 16 n=2 Tax=Branchiostoma floridae TaxID=7739 RepID=A0A9J7L0M0_BRAFL|nr:BTB/POZ domain-containing protein 16-like isoform X1 [Branchiostoma floridae]